MGFLQILENTSRKGFGISISYDKGNEKSDDLSIIARVQLVGTRRFELLTPTTPR